MQPRGKSQIWLKVLSLGVYFRGTKDSHVSGYKELGWEEVVCHVAAGCGYAGVGGEGQAKVAGVANGKWVVQEWVLFMGAAAVELGAVQSSVCAGFW